jgi:hypothetical protein
MPSSSCDHRESWYLTIDKEEGDDWPDLPPYSGARYEIRPDRITALITSGDTNPHVTLSGLRVKKDGTTGSLRANHRIYRPGEVPWVDEVVRKARSQHNLTDEALSRPA